MPSQALLHCSYTGTLKMLVPRDTVSSDPRLEEPEGLQAAAVLKLTLHEQLGTS